MEEKLNHLLTHQHLYSLKIVQLTSIRQRLFEYLSFILQLH